MEPLGPAVLWSHPEFLAKVGFISPWSCNFCDRCNRLRVTARAHLRLCLFGKEEIKLPAEQGDEVVSQFIRSVLHQKPLSHDLEKGDRGSLSYFKVVGG
ncbi:MAG: hypothetical protein A3G92_00525 [Deltaproteobacteria bacterium RIFCSPLOWO2_12_FULL_38_8]|nr:MAG: hypothetical protein A3G92_00525 [Deltaproteobacteria bacterium RIFCSPLOWO2_12_FULL_38_8]